MRAVVRPALAVLLLVGVGIAGVDLPDRAGPPCPTCCDAADPDAGAAQPAQPANGVRVAPPRPVQMAPALAPATPDRAAKILVAAPKTSPPIEIV